MKVALVHDYLNQSGGAERVLEVFTEIWPDAPIFTSLYDEERTKGIFRGKEIITSFVQRLPFASRWHRGTFLCMPFAFEGFNLNEFDVILSSSASFAKGVVGGR